jgi:hypothetical protein
MQTTFTSTLSEANRFIHRYKDAGLLWEQWFETESIYESYKNITNK